MTILGHNHVPRVDPTFYPLGQIPFESYCLLLDKHMEKLVTFIPYTMEHDLKGNTEFHKVVYWYPVYVNKLFELAAEGGDFLGWLRALSPYNVRYFVEIFPTTLKKLDKIKEEKLKKNLHGETIVEIK